MGGRNGVFDPSTYEPVRRPLAEAECLPAWCYTAQEFYDREVDRIFLRCWNFVGREDELPKVGDYQVFDFVGQSVIIVRNRDGKLGAFLNSCRHRGTRLLDGRGTCRAISCPYHAWAYSLSGQLVATPGMEDIRNFDKREWGLTPVRLETWGGFIFISFSHSAPDLRTYLGDFTEKFGSYKFEDMVLTRRHDYQLDCNWKLYVENAMEDYHTPTVHRGSIGLQKTIPEDSHGQWDAIHMEAAGTIGVLPGESTTFPHIPTLSGKAGTGAYFALIYPATFFATTKDCMWFLQTIPLGPAKMKLSVGSCFPRSTVERPDFPEVVQRYYTRWDKSIPEDNAISERQQDGLRTSLARPGRLSLREPVVHSIANWVLDRVLDQRVVA
jgi:phenylpropionate dioxygenase-like ring-hydroxylating dioxygenase large terminal subunit